MTVIPWDILVWQNLIAGPSKSLKLFRILRLVKLVKVLRASRIIQRWQNAVDLSQIIYQIAVAASVLLRI